MDFKNTTISELKQYCRDNKIKGFSNKKKAEIIRLIENNKHGYEIKRVINYNLDKKFNALDLFCGCGGMTEGLKKTCNILCGIDIWDKAIESYSHNNDHLALCKDLKEFKPYHLAALLPASLDIIVGGPPCQGFSIAGKRDIKDPRNSLFMEFYEYITFFKPKAFIMENVMGILSMKNGKGQKCIDIIMNKLEENYNCQINKLYAQDFEVPQKRRRVIIIGVRKDLYINPEIIEPFLTKDKYIPVKEILENNPDEKLYLSQKAIDGINKRKILMLKKGNGFGAQYLDLNKPSYTIPSRYWKDGYDALVKYNDKKIRRLSILELKRIQTFPDDYYLVGNKKEKIIQIGNAVACKFAYHLGVYINKLLLQQENTI